MAPQDERIPAWLRLWEGVQSVVTVRAAPPTALVTDMVRLLGCCW